MKALTRIINAFLNKISAFWRNDLLKDWKHFALRILIVRQDVLTVLYCFILFK